MYIKSSLFKGLLGGLNRPQASGNILNIVTTSTQTELHSWLSHFTVITVTLDRLFLMILAMMRMTEILKYPSITR